jgi:integrase
MVETKKKGCRGKQPFGSRCYRLFGGRDGASSSNITQPRLPRSQSRRGNLSACGELTGHWGLLNFPWSRLRALRCALLRSRAVRPLWITQNPLQVRGFYATWLQHELQWRATLSVRKRTWITAKGEAKEAWIVDCFDKDGVRHIQTFATKGEAEDHAAKTRINVKRGRHTAPSKSITVAEACDKWIKRVEADGRERSTIDQYRQHTRIHIVPRLGKVKLASLEAKAEGFREDLLASLSRPLARKVLTSFHQMLKSNKYSHVAQGITISTSKRDKRKLEIGRDIPTTAEIRRMVDAATDTRARALVLLAAFTGLRASELRGLRWSDIDDKRGEVHVRQRADGYREIGDPKSEGSRRSVPLDLGTVGLALKEWKMACPKFESNLVFPATNGRPMHQKVFLHILRRVINGAGVRNKYGLHAFRHFFASWCINPKADGGRALPPKSVQALLGHSSIVMTLDVYGHLFPRNDDPAELAKSIRSVLA